MLIHFLASLAVTLVLLPSLLAQWLDGVWRSQGYGTVITIQGPKLEAFEVTTTTCVPGFTAERDLTTIAGRQATFKTPEGQVLFIRAAGTADGRRNRDSRLEKEFRGDVETLAQTLDVDFVQLPFAAQNFRHHAWSSEHVHKVLLLEPVLVHQEMGRLP